MKSLITPFRTPALICAALLIFAAPLRAQIAADGGLAGIDTSSMDGAGGIPGPSKPKPKVTPTPTPQPDGESDWKNTGGTDWNTGANWTAVSGSAPPVAGDVAWFKTA